MSIRLLTILTALTWPVGLSLVVANQESEAISLTVFVLLDVVYAACVLSLLQAWNAQRDLPAAALVGVGTGAFAMLGFTGEPTAADPSLYMVNTAVLLVVALALEAIAVHVLVSRRASVHVAAAIPAVVLFLIGSTVYLANLVARFAVVFSGAADRQAAAEADYWVAFEYLRGLEPSPDFVGYLLVWLDLLQVGYVITAYLCFAGLARLFQREGALPRRAGRLVVTLARLLAAIGLGGVVLAAVLPRNADAVPAWAAFVVSIPFMTTLVPFVLGLALLRGRVDRASAPTLQPALPEGRIKS